MTLKCTYIVRRWKRLHANMLEQRGCQSGNAPVRPQLHHSQCYGNTLMQGAIGLCMLLILHNFD